MKRIRQIAFLTVALVLTGCTEGKYPFSNQTCGADDAVRGLDMNDCIAVPAM